MRDDPSRQLVIKRHMVIDKGNIAGENPVINNMLIIRKLRQKTTLQNIELK